MLEEVCPLAHGLNGDSYGYQEFQAKFTCYRFVKKERFGQSTVSEAGQ